MKPAIVWVDILLSKWGRHEISTENGGKGFPSSCLLALSGDGDGYDSSVPKGVVDPDVLAVGEAVMQLQIVQVACVFQYYVRGCGRPDSENAHTLGISYKTLTQYIHQAQRKIALDISLPCTQNSLQSVNGGSCPEINQPVLARA